MRRISVSWRRLAVLTFVVFARCGGSGGPDGGGTPTEPPPRLIAASLSVTPATINLALAATQQLTVTARTADGQTIASPVVTWSSSNPSVVSVSSAGLITALARGSATITASVDGVPGTSAVNAGASTHVLTLAPATYSLAAGDSLQLTPTYSVDGVTQPTPHITWMSSDSTDVRVGAYGRVISDGPDATVVITATTDSASATATVTVRHVTKNLPRIIYDLQVGPPNAPIYYGQVRVLYADGTGDVRVTPPVQDVQGWDVAPDGRSIVAMYGSTALNGGPFYGKVAGLHVNIDPYAETALAHIMNTPTWSPDGRKVAFTRSQANLETDLFVINADGSGEQQLTTLSGFLSQPRWSPDGRTILFVHADAGVAHLWKVGADGTGVQRLPTVATAENASWSPDGTRIAFDDNRNVWVMNADGSGATRITDACPAGSACDYTEWMMFPTWSPDGTQIAYGSAREIVIAHPDGTAALHVPIKAVVAGSARWSPDGSQLLFGTQQSGGTPWPCITIMDRNGANLRQITAGRNATSPRWLGGP
jgi:WD40 repeat protein